VEALSSCPTNWRTNAEETWRFVEQDMVKHFQVGEIKTPAVKEKAG
jgi:2-oxoglutarate ferredoxin oxidoreductase subunit beta